MGQDALGVAQNGKIFALIELMIHAIVVNIPGGVA